MNYDPEWQVEVLDVVIAHWERLGYGHSKSQGNYREPNKICVTDVPPPAPRSSLTVACYKNPFSNDAPPLTCFHVVNNNDHYRGVVHAGVSVYRAVVTRSPDVIACTVDEMVAEMRRQLAKAHP